MARLWGDRNRGAPYGSGVHTGHMAKLRLMFDGTGPYSGFAIACWLVGFIWFLSIVMSADGLSWWLNVHTVQGQEQDGLVYYSVGGTRYTVDDPQSFPGSKPRTMTVYYLPSQPNDATLHNTANQVIDWSLTAAPGVLGLGLFVVGFAKRSGRSRRANASALPDSFGSGIPSETIRALLARDRTPPA